MHSEQVLQAWRGVGCWVLATPTCPVRLRRQMQLRRLWEKLNPGGWGYVLITEAQIE